jgi:ubiquinone/menaquinone biosynthesis C-methylase UbiE
MAEIKKRDGERLIPDSFKGESDYLAFLKHLFAYEYLNKIKNSKKRALEIGFGSGYGTFHASNFLSHIDAIEVDQETVNFAKEKYSSPKISYGTFNGKTIPFPEDTFDLVYSFQVIEHVQEDEHFLKEAKRVLRPGGTLLITTPNRNYRLKPGEKPKNRFHVREYSEIDLENLTKKAFTQFEVLGLFGKGEVHQIEINRVKQGLGHLDPFGLRHMIPEKFKTKIKCLLNYYLRNNTTNNTVTVEYLDKYSTNDYYISKEDIAGSLDLYVIALKD